MLTKDGHASFAPIGDDRGQAARYSGPLFREAARLHVGPGLAHPRRMAALIASVLRRPRSLVALVELLRLTPQQVVGLTGSAEGRALGHYFNNRALGLIPQNRLCRGVLFVPLEHQAYLRGRRRQALRTNLRKAAAADIGCEQSPDRERALAAVEEILAAQRNAPSEELRKDVVWRVSLPEATLFLARSASGEPLAVLGAVIDRDVCLIRVAVARDHRARWALHDHLVRELGARGVSYLVAEGGGPFGALGLSAELHHYQHLLGYELRHLVPRKA